MPSLSSHQSSTTTKLLVIGDSGGGKTGALASLVRAGYRLFIVDFDNGLDILVNQIKTFGDPKLLDQVQFETCQDKFKILGPRAVPTSAAAWPEGLKALEKFAALATGPKDILVLDTLTFAARAAMRYILHLNGRLASGKAEIQDWGGAQVLVQGLIDMLTSDELSCNVIVNAHVKYIGNEESGEPVRGFPETIGRSLSPSIARGFNSLLLCRSVGSGPATKREIHTNTYSNIDLKNPNPAKVKPTYPIATGLADYFAAIRGQA